jgi:hypothetical protein
MKPHATHKWAPRAGRVVASLSSRRDSLSFVAILLRNIEARQATRADFQHLRRGILIALFISGNQLTF